MKAVLFFKSLLQLLLLNGLIKPLWIFGVDRQVQNVVGHEAYGTYFSLLNLSLVFSFLTDAGLSTMMNRQVASGVACNGPQLLRLKIFLAVVYSLLVILVASFTGLQQWRLLLPVIGTQVLLSFFNFLRSLITAHQLYRWDAWLSVVDKALMLLLFLPLLYGPFFQNPITIIFFVQAQFFCTAAATGIALLLVLKKKLLQPTVPLQSYISILKSVLPYALIILAMAAHNRLDGFLLERLHPRGAYEAGVYAASYRLLDAANMVGYLVASFLVPFIARHQANKRLVQEVVVTARYGLLLFGIWVALLLVVFAFPVQQLLYPSATPYTAQVMQWCLPVLPAYLLLHVYGSLLTAMGQLKPFLGLLAIAVVINVVLNSLLIPHLGAVGCSIAALVSQYSCAISVTLFATRLNSIEYKGWQIIRLAGIAVFLGSLFYFGRLYVHPFWLALIGGVVVLLALFAYLPRLKHSLILAP